MREIKDLPIKRELNEDTRKQGVCMPNGEVYSLHITHNNEVIITDFYDYSKIYSIQDLGFVWMLEGADINEKH